MELFIDNRAVTMDDASAAAITLAVAALTDPEKARAGYTRTLRIPMGATCDAVMGFAGQIHSANHFNATHHTGRIEHEGVVLIEGPLYLDRAVNLTDGTGYYEVHIIGGAKEWVEGARGCSLRGTEVNYARTLTGATIAASWTNSDIVKFLPVVRTRQVADYSSGSVAPAMKILTSDDYHPFINARELITAIFRQHGYAVRSEFLDTPEFRQLFISGNYPTRDVSGVKSAMDFLARRVRSSSAVANSEGRVYADPYRPSFSVGNVVDTASVEESSTLGSTCVDLFSRGGCFQKDDERVAFIPTSGVDAGFQYHLRYTTDAVIGSRTSMRGFDQVYLGEDAPRRFTLANPYPDRRGSLRAGRSYKVVVFDHQAGWQYQLRYVQGSTVIRHPLVLEGRCSAVGIAATTTAVRNPELYIRTSPTGSWTPYYNDWALYDGFVEERGTLDVELTVRTAPESITTGNPKFFDEIFFAGAEPGMRLTLKEGTWVRPVFYAQPGEGASLGFADVCAHNVSQMEFLAAVRQMFNLVFHTDRTTRTVTIEPARLFYIADNPQEWTSRIDFSKPIHIEELGGNLAKQMTWSYRSGDDAVSRFNRENGGRMGEWSATVENAAATNVARTWQNALFTPSLGTAGVVGGAASARLVQAGLSSTEEGTAAIVEGTENLNFLPKIVRFEGMQALPQGQAWGWPQPSGNYPKLAFHAPESGYTLCFEDRDGVQGLHTFWDADVRLWNGSRRVTLNLALSAVDIENADFRRPIALVIDGERALYRLEEIVDYSPTATSTKCVLIKHIP